MKGRPFALIGINSDSVEDAKKAIEREKLNWRSFQNSPEGWERSISDDWMVRGWPTIVVLDADFKHGRESSDADIRACTSTWNQFIKLRCAGW